MSLVDEPITRQEMYLNYLNGNTDITLPEPITRIERYLYALCMNGGGVGGGEGTSNYNNLLNLPSIEGITLKGNKTLSDLGIQPDGETIVQNLDGTMSVKGGSGEGGTSDYNDLGNKPSIDGVELEGNKTLAQLGIQPEGNYLTEIPSEYVTDEKLKQKGYLTEIPDNYVTDKKLEEKGYLDKIPEEYVTKSEMESFAQPKGDYLTEVPKEYVTDTELKQYAQPKGNYVNTSETESFEINIDDDGNLIYTDGFIIKKGGSQNG